jgi:hypothetical protein
MKITGNTFPHKKLFQQSKFRWNAIDKSWDGEIEKALDFQQAAILELIQSGECREAQAMENRNGPDRFEIDNRSI